MKRTFYLIIILLFSSLTLKSQTYLSTNIGKDNLGFSLLINENKSFSWGFGVDFPKNMGLRGQDFTGFFPDGFRESEVLKKTGSIYFLGGKEINNFNFNLKLGVGTKKWYTQGYNLNYEWYTYRDGGNYFLYGLEIRKIVSNFVVGAGYDNFYGLSATLGIKL